MNKRAQLVTFHWTINYGGILQAYALQENIKKLNVEPEFLNYYNEKDVLSSLSFKRKIFHYIWNPIKKWCFGGRKREKLTEKFRERYLNIGKSKCSTLEEAKKSVEGFDCFIVGSDQVWNAELTGNPDIYLLEYVNSLEKISYAASFGKASLSEKCGAKYEKALNHFKAISVREKSGKELIEDKFGIQSKVVLDPVFLLSQEEWREVAEQSIKKIEDDYILCYYMPTPNVSVTESIKKISKIIAKENNYKIINIGKKEYEKMKIWENNYFDVGPCEFVSLIKGARMVITNSFHGTAFSLIFNKKFIVPVDFGQAEKDRLSNRIECLLNELDLAQRIIDTKTVGSICELESIDYKKTNIMLDLKRRESIQFLKENIIG